MNGKEKERENRKEINKWSLCTVHIYGIPFGSFRSFPIFRPTRENSSIGKELRALSRQKILCHLGKTEPHHRYRYRVLPVPLTRKQPLANKVGRSNGMRARRRNAHIRNRELHHLTHAFSQREMQMLVIFSCNFPKRRKKDFLSTEEKEWIDTI